MSVRIKADRLRQLIESENEGLVSRPEQMAMAQDLLALRASHKRLLEAAEAAARQVNDLRILLTEAQELGLTLFVCGSTYNHEAVLAAIAEAKKVQP